MLMADRVVPGTAADVSSIREAVCINTNKIMDSCRDKDCIEDLPVFPTASSVPYIDNALSVRARCAELLHCEVNVREMSLNRGYYTVDVTYFYDVRGETFPGNQPVRGLAVFDKRVMLFGSEGRVKSYYSNVVDTDIRNDDLPIAAVDAVNPIALHMSIADMPSPASCSEQSDIPVFIREHFGEELVAGTRCRQLLVSLGQFSIIRLERSTQLMIPAYDYCMPDKECVGSSEDDPCTMFSRISFPVEEFFPPDNIDRCEDYKSLI